MATTPRISRGMGRLSPDLWKRLMLSVEDTEWQPEPGNRPVSPATCFLATITGSREVRYGVDPNDADYDENEFIWQYNFAEAVPRWHADAATYPKISAPGASHGRSGTLGPKESNSGAYNLVEILNTSENAGPGVELSDTIQPSAVENGTAVMMYAIRDPGGTEGNANYFYLFSQDNPFSCDEAAGAPSASLNQKLDLGTFISPDMASSTFDFGSFS